MSLALVVGIDWNSWTRRCQHAADVCRALPGGAPAETSRSGRVRRSAGLVDDDLVAVADAARCRPRVSVRSRAAASAADRPQPETRTPRLTTEADVALRERVRSRRSARSSPVRFRLTVSRASCAAALHRRRRTSPGGTGSRTSGPFSTAATNGSPCAVQVTRGGRTARGRVASRARVGVDEVEPRRPATPGEQHRAGRRRDGVPAHVRQDSARAAARPTPGARRALGHHAVLDPRSNRICMPTQIPSTGRPPATRSRDDRSPAATASDPPCRPRRRRRREPRARRRPQRRSRSAVTVTSRAGPGQRPLGRAQVARAVVEDDDLAVPLLGQTGTAGCRCPRLLTRVRRRRSPSRSCCAASTALVTARPWCDGMPATRGSSATASRSARATALNCASTMWCASRPPSTPDVQRDARAVQRRSRRRAGSASSRTAGRWSAACPPARRAPGTAGRTGRPRTCASASSSGTSASPNRRMPGLVAERLRGTPRPARSRCPRPCGGRRSRRSPLVRTVRSKPPCLPSWDSMWS